MSKGYSAEDLDGAIGAVKRKTLSVKAAAIEFGIPRSTLRGHVDGKVTGPKGRGTDLTSEDEATSRSVSQPHGQPWTPCYQVAY